MDLKDIKYSSLPFWSWNGELTKDKLLEQIDIMKKHGYGGFFMHARSGLKTKYLSDEWFDCIKACCDYAKQKGMQAWAYDENGWPSGFVGGKLIDTKDFRHRYLTAVSGDFDKIADFHYAEKGDSLVRVEQPFCGKCLNVYVNESISYVDVLSDYVVNAFIKETHEKYKDKIKDISDNLCGFFTDEPGYKGISFPYPHKLPEYFKKKYGEDLNDRLGLLFENKKGYETFKYRFFKCCQELFLKNYAEKIYNWHEKNGLKFTGHYIEERTMFTQMLNNAGIMPYYEYLHIPAIDWLCKRYMSVSVLRQLTSVACQLGKKYVMTETFAMCGWDVTPKELKSMLDYQYAYGINMMCPHLFPYSEKGLRKNDHPPHFSTFNPWIDKAMPKLNMYSDNLGEWVRNSYEPVDVSVLFPIRSAYIDYDPRDWDSCAELDESYVGLCDILAQKCVPFHLVDETILAKYGSVSGNKLKVGACEYSTLIMPKCYVIDGTTDKLLKEFVSGGGRILMTDGKPHLLDGLPHEFTYLKSNCCLENIISQSPYKLECDNSVHSVLRIYNGKKYLFVINTTAKKTVHAKATVDGKVFDGRFDVTTGKTEYFGSIAEIPPFESVIMCEYSGTEITHSIVEEIKIGGGEYEITDCTDNYLPLDFAELSYDGKVYEPKAALVNIFQRLLRERYDGNVCLKYRFTTKTLPKDIGLLIEESDNVQVFVNGKTVVLKDCPDKDGIYRKADIADNVVKGENEIIVKFRFYENDNVYYVLFGENVGAGLKNCMTYDTEMQSPILVGKFGVYSPDMTDGNTKLTLLANSFYIDTLPEKAADLNRNGFAFFAGRINLRTRFSAKDEKVVLRLTGRYHFAEITVNGKKAGSLVFGDRIDVSEFVNKGENVLDIALYSGNRNLYGPHHSLAFEDDNYIEPSSFDMSSGWENGKSKDFTERYAFSRFGLFDVKE